MNFEFTPKMQDLYDRAESFIEDEIRPLENEYWHWNHDPDNLWKRWPKKAAMDLIASVTVVAPNMCQQVADRALQVHGGMGVCDDTPIAYYFTLARYIRIADGPDEVHMDQLARKLIKRYTQ